jgi:hypothetical protein
MSSDGIDSGVAEIKLPFILGRVIFTVGVNFELSMQVWLQLLVLLVNIISTNILY